MSNTMSFHRIAHVLLTDAAPIDAAAGTYDRLLILIDEDGACTQINLFSYTGPDTLEIESMSDRSVAWDRAFKLSGNRKREAGRRAA